MRNIETDAKPSAPVSGTGPRSRMKPAEDAWLRWGWTEASVWTDRMLTALEQGVKGGRRKNAFFAERGLFNLTAAHALVCQSSRQVTPPTGEPCAGDPHARFGGRGV